MPPSPITVVCCAFESISTGLVWLGVDERLSLVNVAFSGLLSMSNFTTSRIVSAKLIFLDIFASTSRFVFQCVSFACA